MTSELEITFDLYYVFVWWGVLFHHLQYFYLEFELLVELITYFQNFKGIFSVVFVVHNLQYLSKSSWTQNPQNLKPIANVIPNQSLIVVLPILKSLLVLHKKTTTLRRWALWPI